MVGDSRYEARNATAATPANFTRFHPGNRTSSPAICMRTESRIALSRRQVLVGRVGLSLAAGLPATASSQGDQAKKESNVAKPSIVFVHGIWADGSSFQQLIPTLRAEGHEVI